MKRLQKEPFALIGINSDPDRNGLKPVLEKEQITWRSFWNGPKGTGGPISSAWKIRGWPTIYVLDGNGVIRARDVRGPAMDRAVDGLLAEMTNRKE